MAEWDGKRLFRKRKAEGLTQAKAANRFDASVAAWRTWEHGKEPSPIYRQLLDEWIGEDDEAPAEPEPQPEALEAIRRSVELMASFQERTAIALEAVAEQLATDRTTVALELVAEQNAALAGMLERLGQRETG